MKNTLNSLFLGALVLASLTFTSCEKDELSSDFESVENLQETPENLNKVNTILPVSRYYSGGSNTVHTYQVLNLGVRHGTYEGRPFKLGTYDFISAPPSGTRQIFFLLAPGNKDFVMTTSTSEKSNLLRRGWRDYSTKALYSNIKKAAYIHTGAGSGRVKLYRFYGASNTDHLYTTNYNEGISAGYIYEGVIGYVYR
ncbi:hypothetical protein GCM10009430_23260 [Aquimarina litoralis]|uniref:DUF5648 domain-containing protein n=1 Tax=Aquimarina litoralis TaxID=584605 RepID=A0ABP3U007_9FLAO